MIIDDSLVLGVNRGVGDEVSRGNNDRVYSDIYNEVVSSDGEGVDL